MKTIRTINIIRKDGTIDSKTVEEAAREGRKNGIDLRTTSRRLRILSEEQNTQKSA